MVYRFGAFEYDGAQRLLFRDGEVVPVLPKAIDTLHALLERRGNVVDKAELMKQVWPDTVVEEIGLARNISLLRKALGETETGGYIETIPKRGYRFVAEVTAAGEEAAPAAKKKTWGRGALAAALAAAGGLVYWQFYLPSRFLPGGNSVPSLAVIPFEILSPGVPESLPGALNEVLVAELSRVPGIQVLSPSSVRRYRRLGIPVTLMARLVGLQVVLEGTLRGEGERFLVSARLADVHTGKLIWADAFEAPAGAVENEAARRIAAGAAVRLKR